MESKEIIKEVLKKLQEEKNRIDKKLIEGYPLSECRNESFECDRCIDIVIGVAENNFSKNNIRKIVKEEYINE